jgi:phage FluMu gp28-like protein
MTSLDGVLKDYLRPYQRKLLQDDSNRIIILKSRRIGYSEAVCVLCILLAIETAYHDVYLCSTSYTNAKELLRRISIWIDVFKMLGVDLGIKSRNVTGIEFNNGSRIIPMPALKVRSRTGTIILDEFPIYKADREVWKAASPVGETSSRFRLILVGTPFGASGAFYDVWADPQGIYQDWKRYKVDIYQAAEEGFPVDPAEMRKRYPEDVWLQEFCCEFLSDINQYFSHDLIRRCGYSQDDVDDGLLNYGLRYAGIDLGSTQDASILANGHDLPRDGFAAGLLHTIKAAGTTRDYSPQFVDIKDILRQHAYASVGTDATGEGAQLSQDLVKEFGKRTVHAVKGGQWAEVYELIPEIRLLMERRKFKIPVDDYRLRHAFTKIQKIQTTDKNITYKAEKDAYGHADEFYAVLLSYYAKKRMRTPLGPLPPYTIR